jgi:hypothetical protein
MSVFSAVKSNWKAVVKVNVNPEIAAALKENAAVIKVSEKLDHLKGFWKNSNPDQLQAKLDTEIHDLEKAKQVLVSAII